MKNVRLNNHIKLCVALEGAVLTRKALTECDNTFQSKIMNLEVSALNDDINKIVLRLEALKSRSSKLLKVE